MSGKTFRSRWVVGWGVVFGGLCSGAAILMFMAAFRSGQPADSVSEVEAKKIQKICEEQLANGGGSDDSRCFRTSGAGANENVKGMVAAAVLGALGAVQLIGAARIGVTLTGRGVIVRNPLRTHRLEWSEIDRFYTEVGRARGMSYAFGRVDLLNGDTHRIEAIAAMPWEDKNNFEDERVIDALNAELEEWRANPDRSEDELLSRFDFGDGPMRVYDMFVHDDDDDREPPKVKAGDPRGPRRADTEASADTVVVDGDEGEGQLRTVHLPAGAEAVSTEHEVAEVEAAGDAAAEPEWTDEARHDDSYDGDDAYEDPIGAPDDPIDSVRTATERPD